MRDAIEADETAVDALTEARRHYDQERFQECLSALRRAGDDALDDPQFWFLRAECLRLTGKVKDAATAAKTALGRWPDHIGLLDSLGLAYLARRRVSKADEAFRSALQVAPDTPFLLAHHAMALRRLGRIDEATRVYDRLLAIDPDAPSANHARAALAIAFHDPRADRFVSDVLADDPDDPTGHSLRGRLALQRRQSGEAVAAYRDAAALNPGSISSAKMARWAQVLDHPLMFPSRWILMLGSTRARILGFGVSIVLNALGQHVLAGIWFAFWLIFVLVLPRILRNNLARRHGSL
jgi:tetratricopeptide (TPR) repeat protein